MSRSRDRWNCRRKLCHLDYLSALMHARRLNHDGLVIYPCRICHHLHLGHMKQPTPQQKKRARLERKIAEVRRQLAQLRRNLQELLAEEAKRAATDDSNPSPGT